jgi:hypothetical protein
MKTFAALCIGSILGLALFSVMYDSRYQYPKQHVARQYGGTVVSHDPEHRRMTIALQPVFFSSDPVSTHLQFTYDEKTEWASIHYTFRDGVANDRILHREEPMPLATGTFVSLIRRTENSGPIVALSVAFLRRTDL